ncbi:MAG: nucleotidyltransferase family protein [Pseudomonadota bacterium]
MRDDPNALMIFAAGFGTRMAPLTDTVPKPLIPVAGKALLDHALDPAQALGLGPVAVNAHYRADQIVAALSGTDVTVLREEPEVLDTGGGLKAALAVLTGDAVMTMNADAVWNGPNPYAVLRAAWDPEAMDALLLCVPMARAWGRADAGDFTVRDGGRPVRGPGWVYCGAQIIKSAVIGAVPDRVFGLNRVWDELMDQDRLRVADYPGQWCDVGRPSSIPLAEEMLRV